jgi:hypothetical protein
MQETFHQVSHDLIGPVQPEQWQVIGHSLSIDKAVRSGRAVGQLLPAQSINYVRSNGQSISSINRDRIDPGS